jgi:hypothetical protein
MTKGNSPFSHFAVNAYLRFMTEMEQLGTLYSADAVLQPRQKYSTAFTEIFYDILQSQKTNLGLLP